MLSRQEPLAPASCRLSQGHLDLACDRETPSPEAPTSAALFSRKPYNPPPLWALTPWKYGIYFMLEERNAGEIADFCIYPLTSSERRLAYIYHLRSNSGSNGPIAKECHRFLVAGPFYFYSNPLRVGGFTLVTFPRAFLGSL
jgi:hypothetical protein